MCSFFAGFVFMLLLLLLLLLLQYIRSVVAQLRRGTSITFLLFIVAVAAATDAVLLCCCAVVCCCCCCCCCWERDRRAKWDDVGALELHMAMLVNRAALNEQVAQRFGIGYQPPPAESATNLTRSGLQRKRVAELENGVSNAARLVHLRTLSMQGLWARWDNVANQDLSWRRMFSGHISQEVLKFLVNSMLLTLPSEDNKRRWFKQASRVVSLCCGPSGQWKRLWQGPSDGDACSHRVRCRAATRALHMAAQFRVACPKGASYPACR